MTFSKLHGLCSDKWENDFNPLTEHDVCIRSHIVLFQWV